MMGEKRKPAVAPGDEARQRGASPTDQNRSDENGQGAKAGVATDADKEKAQEAELEMNEENR